MPVTNQALGIGRLATDSGPRLRAWLVFGSLRLLTGDLPPSGEQVLVLAPAPTEGFSAPANTVVIRWSQLGAINLTARTIDGCQARTETTNGHRLFSGITPGPALRRLSPQASAVAPLFFLAAGTTSGGVDLHVHSQVRFHPEDACFLRITEAPLRAGGVQDLSWLPAALDLHRRHGTALNSHDCQYRTCLPGLELEHKYTLPPDADIWALAAQTHLRLSNGDLPGFAPKYRDETQAWDYVNHLYEVTEPEQERGYVAFIPTADGRHLVKRKRFAIDAAARREQHTFGVDIDCGYDEHLRRVLGLRARPLPPFRRVRYDVNIESARTGHVFGVLYDRCHLLDAPDEVLCQCEIETPGPAPSSQPPSTTCSRTWRPSRPGWKRSSGNTDRPRLAAGTRS